jgi:hypothetical protein
VLTPKGVREQKTLARRMSERFPEVFYRNKTGKILVKILYNEKETTIPAISPFCDCYYEWDAFRTYLSQKI